MQDEGGTKFWGQDEISRMMEGGDWDDSILGPPSTWPFCLRSAVDIMLPAMAQIVIFWGIRPGRPLQ